MNWDNVTNFLGSRGGPMALVACLAAIDLFVSGTDSPNIPAIAFTFVAEIVASHFEFTISEQYMIVIGIFSGVRGVVKRVNK
jgi:hypothetical protein